MRRRYLKGLLAMLLVYTIFFLLAREPFVRHAFPLSRKWLHVIQLAGIVLVYLIGIQVFRKNAANDQWQLNIWNIAHFLLIPLLMILGIADWAIGGLPVGWRLLAQSLGETLISPVLYVGIWLLNYLFIGRDTAKDVH